MSKHTQNSPGQKMREKPDFSPGNLLDQLRSLPQKKFLVASIALHIVIFSVFFIHWDWTDPVKPLYIPSNIQAHVVTPDMLQALKEKQETEPKVSQEKIVDEKKLEEQKRKEILEKEQAQQKVAEEKQRVEQEKLKIKKQQEEQEKKKQLEKQKELEKQKQLEKQKKLEAEKKKKLEEEKKKLEEEKKKLEAERKKKLEAEKKKAEELAKKEKLKDEKSKEILEKEQKMREMLKRMEQQQALASQQAALEAEQQQAFQTFELTEVERYLALIKQRIENAWHIPPKSEGLSITLRIRLLPNGELSSVDVLKSSGSNALDRSAIQAVRSVTRYPVPDNGRIFEKNFRQFSMMFTPQAN